MRDRDVTARRASHVGRLLFELSGAFERESLRRLQEAGHPRLTQGQKQVIIQMPLAGARLTTLAARLGVSKQAAMKLVDGLEVLGYLRRAADPDDQRAKLVVLTERGRGLIEQGLAIVEDLEREYAARLGARRLATLRTDLAALAASLGLTMPDG